MSNIVENADLHLISRADKSVRNIVQYICTSDFSLQQMLIILHVAVIQIFIFKMYILYCDILI